MSDGNDAPWLNDPAVGQPSAPAGAAPAPDPNAPSTPAPVVMPYDADAGIVRNPDGTIRQLHGGISVDTKDASGNWVPGSDLTGDPNVIASFLAKHPEDPANRVGARASTAPSSPDATQGQAVSSAAPDAEPWANDPVVSATPSGVPTSYPTTGLAGGVRLADTILRQAANGLTGGFADKLEAGLAAAPEIFHGGMSAVANAYSHNMDIEQARDKADFDQVPAVAYPAGVAGAIGQALALPEAKAMGIAGRIGMGAAQGAAMGAADTLGKARGDAVQELAQVPLPAALGALGGGVLGGALGPRLSAVAPHTVPGAATAADYAATGVSPMLAVNGTPTQQRVGQLLSGLPLVGTPLVKAAAKNVGAFDQGVRNIAEGLGSSQTAEEAGSALQKGALDRVAEMKARSGELYKPINAFSDSTIPVSTLHSQEAVRGMFGANPATAQEFASRNPIVGSLGRTLERTRAPAKFNARGGAPIDAPPGESTLTFGELKALRSEVGRHMDSAAILNNGEQRNLKTLYAALSKDMENAAYRIGGDQGLANMRAANAHEAQMHKIIDETLNQVIAKDGHGNMMPAEQAYARLVTDLKNGAGADGQQVRQLKAVLPPQAWREVAASIVHNLGRTGEEFSTAKFATAWEKLSPAAKEALFPKAQRDALDSFSRVAGDMKRASKFYNHSNSAHGVGLFAVLETVGEAANHMLHGNVPEAAGALAVPAVSVLGGRYISKLLSEPKFAETFMNAAKIKGPNAAGLVDQLFARYAANNPAIKTEMDAFRAALMRRALSNAPKTILADGVSRSGGRTATQ